MEESVGVFQMFEELILLILFKQGDNMPKIPIDEYEDWTPKQLQSIYDEGWITKKELQNALRIKKLNQKRKAKKAKKKR